MRINPSRKHANDQPPNSARKTTGSWFAWANSVFAQTILDLARRKPHLLFGEDAEPYVFG